MMRIALVLALLLSVVPATSVSAEAEVAVTPVSFEVTNPQDPLAAPYTIEGSLYEPEGGCTASVMLLLHGLSYGAWGWDLPGYEDTYSVARDLARDGFAAVAIDRLGYGHSHGGGYGPDAQAQTNGYTLSVQAYAHMTSQIVEQLRAQGFSKVGLMGHSAGTEISELTAGLFGGVDVLVATAYHHFPSQRIVTDFITGDVVRAAMDDYEYFGENEAQRSEYMFDLANADPAVVQLDNELAHLTPSGEVWSISNQPSRQIVPLIDVPVLLVLAENDLLFPVMSDSVEGQNNGENELALFLSSPDKELLAVPDAGHSFMLHPNVGATNAAVGDWLDDRIPTCG